MKVISFLLILSACATEQPKFDPINTPLEARHDEYRSCFLESESYKGTKEVEKRVVKVSFIIDPTGKVTEAKIAETEFKDANFHACLLEQMRMVGFQPPVDGKHIQVLRAINFYPDYK